MAADKSVRIDVRNLKAAQRAVRKAKDSEIDRAMQAAYQEVSTIVAEAAKANTPVRSGAQRRDTVAAATKRTARVRVGKRGQRTGKSAGPNVYGWPGRFKGSLTVQKAVSDRWRTIRNTMEKTVRKGLDRI